MATSFVERARALVGTVRQANERDERNEPTPAPSADAIGATAARVAAATEAERAGWRREVVAALRWEAAGHGADPNLARDVATLRRLVPPGTCLDCGELVPLDGRHLCERCEGIDTTHTDGAA